MAESSDPGAWAVAEWGEFLSGGAGDLAWPAVALAGVVLVLLLRTLGRRAPRPRPGEIWFAFVPFEDGTGSKDRPVLVLSVEGRTCTVARFTSQDKGARRDHLRVPDGVPGLHRASWVNKHPVRVKRSALRRRDVLRWLAREERRTAATRRRAPQQGGPRAAAGASRCAPASGRTATR